MTVTLALLSAVVWGSSDFLAGLMSKRMRVIVVVAWSQVAALVLLSVIVAFVGLPGTLAWLPWAALAGICGSLGLFAFYAALSSGTMGVVAPIAATGASIPVLLAVARGESPSPLAWVGIAVALLGVILASGPEIQAGLSARPVLLALGAAVCFGSALFCLDNGARVSVLHTLWGMRLTSCLGYLVVALLARSVGQVSRRDSLLLVVVGLGDLAANALFAVATSSGLLSIASVLGSLYPVATILLARFVLHERLKPIQQVGVLVAMVGIVCIALGGHGG